MNVKDAQPSGPILLYDGLCRFCNTSVQMILRHDQRGLMRFAALQSGYGEAVKARHPELRDVDSMVLVERVSGTGEERVFMRSNAALRIAAYLGGWWRLLLVFGLMPHAVRDCFYDAFARYRYRLFGKYDRCLVPAADVRSRFLDSG
jgi:predicted DCC family thiol-disulfide oxidoreductase YuxK